MAGFTNYCEDKIMNCFFEATNITAPANLSVGLFTTITDAEAGTVTEVSGGSYARQTVAPAGWTTANGATTNASAITFPTATASWGTVVGAGLYDGTNWIVIQTLGTSKLVDINDTFQIAAGDFDVSLD